MRSAILLSLPLAAFALPPPVNPREDALEKRAEDFIPYLIEDACRNTYDKHPDIKRYDKMLAAVKSARELAKTAVKEWWDEGKHGDVAAQYLAIPDDGGYKDSGYAQTVHANLQNVALLDERIPFLSKKVVSRSLLAECLS